MTVPTSRFALNRVTKNERRRTGRPRDFGRRFERHLRRSNHHRLGVS
jgi:hypothetical protein